MLSHTFFLKVNRNNRFTFFVHIAVTSRFHVWLLILYRLVDLSCHPTFTDINLSLSFLSLQPFPMTGWTDGHFMYLHWLHSSILNKTCMYIIRKWHAVWLNDSNFQRIMDFLSFLFIGKIADTKYLNDQRIANVIFSYSNDCYKIELQCCAFFCYCWTSLFPSIFCPSLWQTILKIVLFTFQKQHELIT